MRVSLGKFAVAGLKAQWGGDLRAAVRLALVGYARRLETGGASLPPPRFLVDLDPPEPAHAFELTLDRKTQAALEAEAARRGISVHTIVDHAVMLHLAEQEAEARRGAHVRGPATVSLIAT